MKKFLKENWFKISIVIVLAIIALSVVYYFVVLLPAQQLQENLVKQQKSQSVTSEIDSQQKCADRSAWFWKDEGYDKPSQPNEVDSYTNHWNQNLNKCFILITQSWTTDNTASVQIVSNELVDAFEGKSYGIFWDRGEGLGWLSRTLGSCSMIKDGNTSSSQACTTKTEFDNFVSSYINN